MNTILVSYDLIKDKDYSKIIKHLESYEKQIKPLLSLWLIITPLTAKQVRDAATAHIDQNDKIFVVDITGKDSAWKSLSTKDSEWIKSSP